MGHWCYIAYKVQESLSQNQTNLGNDILDI